MKTILRAISYLIGIAFFMYGIWMFKNIEPYLIGCIVSGIGLVIVSIVDLAPEPSKTKYKLKDKHIEELIQEVNKDALIRELVFLKNERTEELVEIADGLSFEDALIVIKAIEVKYPSITIGREINL